MDSARSLGPANGGLVCLCPGFLTPPRVPRFRTTETFFATRRRGVLRRTDAFHPRSDPLMRDKLIYLRHCRFLRRIASCRSFRGPSNSSVAHGSENAFHRSVTPSRSSIYHGLPFESPSVPDGSRDSDYRSSWSSVRPASSVHSLHPLLERPRTTPEAALGELKA